MHKRLILQLTVMILALSSANATRAAKDDGYDDVVKLVERHYNVKRKDVPLLSRAAIKGGRAIARISSSSIPELAEAGSVHLAVFEDQDFSHPITNVPFMAALRAHLSTEWSPLVQLVSPDDNEQTYIYMREAGEKFRLIAVNISQRNATVLEVKLSPRTLVKLIQDPDVIGETLTKETGSKAP